MPAVTRSVSPICCRLMLQIKGWRRVFAHTADVFFKRGIARPETVRCMKPAGLLEGHIVRDSPLAFAWAASKLCSCGQGRAVHRYCNITPFMPASCNDGCAEGDLIIECGAV